MPADDRTLVDLARRVLGVVAKRRSDEPDRWSVWTTPDRTGVSVQTVGRLCDSDLRAVLLAEAKANADRAALGPPDAERRLEALKARHARELAEAEQHVVDCRAADLRARLDLADARAALADPEAPDAR